MNLAPWLHNAPDLRARVWHNRRPYHMPDQHAASAAEKSGPTHKIYFRILEHLLHGGQVRAEAAVHAEDLRACVCV